MSVTCEVPEEARQAVQAPPLPPGPPTPEAQALAFSVSQEAALRVSEGRRGSAVQALDDCNAHNAELRRRIK